MTKPHLGAAREYLSEAADALSAYYEAHEQAQLYPIVGKLELAQGNLERARVEYQKAIELAARLGMQRELRDWTDALAEIDRQQKLGDGEPRE